MPQLDLTERILRLRQVPTLRGLPAGEVAQLAQSMRTRTFEKGETLLREDEPPRAFFLLVSGTVTMRRRGKRIGTVRGPGGVGFMSFLARNAGGTACVAETFVEAYEVRADAMDEIFEDHFTVLLGTIRFVAQRLVEENRTANEAPPYVPSSQAADHLVGDRELGIVERMFLLRRTRAFSQANLNTLAAVARRMKEIRLPAGETIWRPGDRAGTSLFVVKGMLDLSWNEGETVQELGPGYAIGGGESLVGSPRWNTLVTRTPVVLLEGTSEGIIDMFEDDHELALSFLSMLATVLMTMWDRRAEQGLTSVGTGPSPSERALPEGAPSSPSS